MVQHLLGRNETVAYYLPASNGKIKTEHVITNRRVMLVVNGLIAAQSSLKDVVPVAGFSQSHVEMKQPGMVMTGVWSLLNSPTETKTVQIGNVTFLNGGTPVVTFYQVPDPQGLVNFVIGLQKSMGQTIAEPDRVVKETIVKEVVMIPCSYCRSLMPQTAAFCPNCGARPKG